MNTKLAKRIAAYEKYERYYVKSLFVIHHYKKK